MYLVWQSSFVGTLLFYEWILLLTLLYFHVKLELEWIKLDVVEMYCVYIILIVMVYTIWRVVASWWANI